MGRLVLLSVLLLAGCVYPNVYGSARTLPAGSLGFVGVIDGPVRARSPEDATPEGVPVPIVPRAGLRWGAAEGLEPGFLLGPGSLAIDAKLRLHDAPSFAVSAGPGVGAAWPTDVADGTYLEARLPLAAMIRLGDVVDLTPHVLAGWAYGTTAQRGTGLAGGGLGAIVHVASWLGLQPAFAAMAELDTGFVHYGLGLGVLAGGEMLR